jgi:hypothetical protein
MIAVHEGGRLCAPVCDARNVMQTPGRATQLSYNVLAAARFDVTLADRPHDNDAILVEHGEPFDEHSAHDSEHGDCHADAPAEHQDDRH